MAGNYCRRCQQWRPMVDPASLVNIPGLMMVLHLTFLPRRCAICLAPDRLPLSESEPFPQTPQEINRRLSIFDDTTRDFGEEHSNSPRLGDIDGLVDESRLYLDRLKEYGFLVGGLHERILHVACVTPEFFLSGYITWFFYLLFFPITYWHLRYRRSKNPNAHFFPLDRHRAERVVLTDKRLVLYFEMESFYYRYCSIPIADIREVRQHQSSVRIQLKHAGKPTITMRVGPDLGGLLRAIHGLSNAPVRDASRDWKPRQHQA